MLLIPIICTAILWSSDVVQAHSGPVALAMPVEGIVVDGDLSDWPPDMVRYLLVIRTGDGAPLVGAGDFSGDFRVGYDVEKNLLYVAVDIVDDSVLLSSKGGLNRSSWILVTSLLKCATVRRMYRPYTIP